MRYMQCFGCSRVAKGGLCQHQSVTGRRSISFFFAEGCWRRVMVRRVNVDRSGALHGAVNGQWVSRT